MTLNDLKRWLDANTVPERYYVLGGLGVGEAEGVGLVDGVWSTYYSEHGLYSDVQPYESEDAACRAFAGIIIERMQAAQGVTLSPPP